MNQPTLFRRITYLSQTAFVGCDEHCEKAWGKHQRPSSLDPNTETKFFLADTELGRAPLDPGTEEGPDRKPTLPNDKLNRWCVRECERSSMGPSLVDLRVPDFSQRTPSPF